MDMQPPPAYVQAFAQTDTQVRPDVRLAQADARPQQQQGDQQPVEPTPVKVEVSSYIPAGATSATIILSLTPPTGQALVYTEGSETYGTVFKGGRSVGDIRLDGPYIYVKLYGATSFDIQYLNYRVP